MRMTSRVNANEFRVGSLEALSTRRLADCRETVNHRGLVDPAVVLSRFGVFVWPCGNAGAGAV